MRYLIIIKETRKTGILTTNKGGRTVGNLSANKEGGTEGKFPV